ncbi:MAG: DUF1700 domain-containing protein [Massilia sp.]
MGKLEFLDALKRAMTGLAPEAQAKTLAFYEQRFVDGVAAGRREEDIAAEQDDPKRIAMTLRASTHMQAFETKKNPANLVRMLIAALGLAIFNLFMVVPAMVYAALLAAMYACGLALYLGGAVITASGLSGANEIHLDGPLSKMFSHSDFGDDSRHMKISISDMGIRVFSDDDDEKAPSTSVTIGGTTKANANANAKDDTEHDGASDEEIDKESVRVAKRVESVASNGIMISTDMDDGSRSTQTSLGIGMVLGGIVLLLLCLVVTRYTFIGIKRYIEMNFSLLKGN